MFVACLGFNTVANPTQDVEAISHGFVTAGLVAGYLPIWLNQHISDDMLEGDLTTLAYAGVATLSTLGATHIGSYIKPLIS